MPDRQVRIFKFLSGKVYRKYDESLKTITEMQQAGTSIRKLDDMEFGRRLAVDKELEKSPQAQYINAGKVLFMYSGSKWWMQADIPFMCSIWWKRPLYHICNYARHQR